MKKMSEILTEVEAKASRSAMRASADSYTVVSNEIFINLGLKDLQKLLQKKEAVIELEDDPRGSGRKMIYRIILKYKENNYPRTIKDNYVWCPRVRQLYKKSR